jgi:hypothetical protein
MNRKAIIAAIGVLALSAGFASAQVAGRAKLGVAKVEMDAVFSGWSLKREILNKAVSNDQKEKIGTIDDIIITPDNSAAYAIIGVGGFLGMGRHDVAIPMKQMKLQEGALTLPGATKEQLKELPMFEYARKRASN